MGIKQWPMEDRPREKLLAKGPQALSDAELLAIFLRTGIKGCSAVELSRELLLRFGSLAGLLSATQLDFCAGRGLGEAKYAQLQAVMEMAKRYFAERLTKADVFTSPHAVRAYLRAQLQHQQREVFVGLFLDSQHQLLAYEEIFYGSVASASVHPREIVKLALAHNAAALIVAHNHPSGVAEPSQADIRITDRIKAALDLVDVSLLDHMVVGAGEVCSLAEMGHL
jgi:DNA repair protein RadC